MEFQNETDGDILISLKKFVGPPLVLLIALWGLYYAFVRKYFGSSGMTDCGLFGDMFGGFNAFFAGLGFIAVAITTVIQMQQSHRTQVDTTFFNMLNLLTQIVNNSYFPGSDDKGPKYFRNTIMSLKSTYDMRIQKECIDIGNRLPGNPTVLERMVYIQNIKLPAEVRKQIMIEVYEELYASHEHSLGHYFRYLYNVIKFIRNSFKSNPGIARQYIGLIQAQMSNDELGLLFYNAVSMHGRNLKGEDVFREWLDEYDFFENVDPRCIFHDSFLEFYPKTHFKFKIRQNSKNTRPGGADSHN